MHEKMKNGYSLPVEFVQENESNSSTKPMVKRSLSKAFHNEERVVDGGYAWVVLAAAFVLNMFMAAQFGTLGIWLVEFMHYFNTPTKSPITWIGAAQMFAGYFLGVFNGALMKRYSVRTVTIVSSVMVTTGYTVSAFVPKLPILYIFYGAMSGIGFLNFYLAAVVAVQQYFHKKRAFATGIVSSGLSVGIFIWSPLTRYLIDRYSWQGALLIQAGVFLNGIVFGLLLRPQPKSKEETMRAELAKIASEESSESSDSSSSSSSLCAILSRISCRKFMSFYVFLFGYFFIQIGHMTVYGYTPVKGDALGIPKSKISMLISIMGITGIFARPAIGLLGDFKCANKTVLCGLSALFVGAFSIISTQLSDFVTMAVYSALFGFFSSGYMALYGPVLVDIVGLNNIEVTGGILMVSKGLANLTLHSIAGIVMDATGTPSSVFYLFGGMQALGGVVVILVPTIHRFLKRNETLEEGYEDLQVKIVVNEKKEEFKQPITN